MKRRWIIRGLFMLPILLCIVGWGWSTTHDAMAGYCRGGNGVFMNTSWGALGLGFGPIGRPDGWICSLTQVEVNSLPPNPMQPDSLPLRSFFGFGQLSIPQWHSFYIPYWFLILSLSTVLNMVWCRNRPEAKAGAFMAFLKGIPSRAILMIMVGVLVLILTGAVFGQFWLANLYITRGCILEYSNIGLFICWYPDLPCDWSMTIRREFVMWDVDMPYLFSMPKIEHGFTMTGEVWDMAIPWWFILVMWVGLTFWVWRLTRKRKTGGAFPVETNTKGTA